MTTKHQSPNTRKGAASFYVVIFAALVFTVIVLSFIRLMISEATQNIGADLSQSAYDSALAGIEDAKAAVTKCLNSSNRAACESTLYDTNNCSSVAQVLYGRNIGEISADADQAYTCTILSKELTDYLVRLPLASSERVAVVPIDGAHVAKISIEWFTQENNEQHYSSVQTLNNISLYDRQQPITPPVVSAGVIESNNTHINTLVFRPTNGAEDDIDRAYSNSKTETITNKVVRTKCDLSQDYACKVEIPVNTNADFVILHLPYGEESGVDFRVQKYSPSGSLLTFNNQISVDSTGRANDYYRRVESRLQLSDDFPYPEYALSMTPDSNAELQKYFWVTNNHWVVNDGNPQKCSNDSGPFGNYTCKN